MLFASYAPVLLLWALTLAPGSLCSTRGLSRGRQRQGDYPTPPPDFKFERFELPPECGANQFEKFDTTLRRGRPGRIADSPEYERKHFPSVVQVISFEYDVEKPNYCTGTLVHPRVVITSADCVRGQFDIFVYASFHFVWHPQFDLDSLYEKPHRVQYYCLMAPQFADNVALLVLPRALELQAFQRVACMDSSVLRVGEPALSVGLGFSTENPRKFTKRVRALKVARTSQCEPYKNSQKISCYAPINDNQPPKGAWCRGDQGGPVFRVDGRGRHHLNGVIDAIQQDRSRCKENNSTMVGYATNIAYVNATHIHKWLRADQSAYNTQCFKPKYHYYP